MSGPEQPEKTDLAASLLAGIEHADGDGPAGYFWESAVEGECEK